MRPQLEPATTDQLSVTQIAEGLAGERSPSEIVNAIIEHGRHSNLLNWLNFSIALKSFRLRPRSFTARQVF